MTILALVAAALIPSLVVLGAAILLATYRVAHERVTAARAARPVDEHREGRASKA